MVIRCCGLAGPLAALDHRRDDRRGGDGVLHGIRSQPCSSFREHDLPHFIGYERNFGAWLLSSCSFLGGSCDALQCYSEWNGFRKLWSQVHGLASLDACC